MNEKAHWPEEEKTLLRQYWATDKPIREWMHLLPGRSEDAIIGRARRLKLGKREVNRKPTRTESWQCIEQLLSDGKFRSTPEIAERTGFNVSVVRKQLQERIRVQVYVAEWRWEVNKWVALFALGVNQYNARRPKPKPKAENQRKYYERRKKFRPDDHEEHLRKRRLREAAKRPAPQTTDPAASWLNNNAETHDPVTQDGFQEESAESQAQGEQGTHGDGGATSVRSLSAFRISDFWRGSASPESRAGEQAR